MAWSMCPSRPETWTNNHSTYDTILKHLIRLQTWRITVTLLTGVSFRVTWPHITSFYIQLTVVLLVCLMWAINTGTSKCLRQPFTWLLQVATILSQHYFIIQSLFLTSLIFFSVVSCGLCNAGQPAAFCRVVGLYEMYQIVLGIISRW